MSLSLVDLPYEVLEHIFKRTTNASKLNLMRVCKRFNDIIGSSVEVMSGISIKIYPHKDSNPGPKDVSIICQSERKYSALLIIGQESYYNDLNYNYYVRPTLSTREIPDMYQLFDQLGNGLTKLNLTDLHIATKDFFYAITQMSNLKNLQCHNIQFIETFEECQLELKHLQELQIDAALFDNNGNPFISVTRAANNLEKLTITDKARQFDDNFFNIVWNFEKLNYLKYAGTTLPDVMSKPAKFQLKEINLTVNKTFGNVTLFLETQTQLETLILRRPGSIREPELEKILQYISNAKELRVFEPIFKFKLKNYSNYNLNNLTTLRIFKIREVRPGLRKALNYLVGMAPNLESLRIDFVSSIRSMNKYQDITPLNKLVKLKTLDVVIKCNSLEQLTLPRLTTITFRQEKEESVSFFSGLNIDPFLKNNPQLIVINFIEGCIDDTTWMHIVEKMPNVLLVTVKYNCCCSFKALMGTIKNSRRSFSYQHDVSLQQVILKRIVK